MIESIEVIFPVVAESAEVVFPTPLASDVAVITRPGSNGLTAYEVAVANGFVGSAAEWLASLGATVTTSNVGTALAAASVKPIPVDADSLAVLDSAEDDEPKLLSFGNLWSWIKSKIDAGQTWAGQHAFSDAIRPTSAGMGTPVAASLITRDDAESNLLFAMLAVRESDQASYTANGGVASQNDGDNLLISAATANLRPVAMRYRNINRVPSSSGAANVVAPIRIASAGTIVHIGSAANGAKFRFAIGMASGAAVPAADINALTGRGFGWEVFWSSVNARLEFGLFAHDGTTYVTSASPLNTGLNPGNNDNYWHIIVGLAGSGVVSAWTWFGASPGVTARPSWTPSITLAGGPTNGSFANLGYCQWTAASHSTVAPSSANAVSVKVLDRRVIMG